MRHWILIVLCAASAGAATLVQSAPSKARRMLPPAAREDDLGVGRKIFLRDCAACHGPEGQGIGKAPPLVTPDIARAEPGAIRWAIRNGSLRHGMPSFAHLPDQQLWPLVVYLKHWTAGPPAQ